MSDAVVVIGSGPSSVHAALTLLEKGRRVTMLDVGRTGSQLPLPSHTFRQLKDELKDPAAYFLGIDQSAVVTPNAGGEYYGFPPGKDHVFSPVEGYSIESDGFAPLSSFALGGLAEAWTGGVYAFSEGDLLDFPFGYDALAPYYDTVSRRVGICGTADDLERFFPTHAHLQEPLALDEHAQRLLERYQRARTYLNERLGCYVGRSRYTTLSRSQDGRPACTYLGRCLWGCPTGAFYTPRVTLEQCLAKPSFTLRSNAYVSHVRFDSTGVRAVVFRDLVGGRMEEVPSTRVFVGAGTLSSSRIFLESLRQAGHPVPVLSGLMDNRQILMPFVSWSMIGRPHDPDTYQYHQLAMGLEGASPKDTVHAQVTTLKSALIHPIVQSLPVDLRTATFLFRNLHAALGLLNINFGDTRRPTNHVALGSPGGPSLRIHYAPPPDETARLRAARRIFKRVLRRLGCIVPPGMTHVRPMGSSVHYAGTLPMSTRSDPLSTSPTGESREIRNLFFIDGTVMPSIPAKNLTLTLMANAARIADAAP